MTRLFSFICRLVGFKWQGVEWSKHYGISSFRECSRILLARITLILESEDASIAPATTATTIGANDGVLETDDILRGERDWSTDGISQLRKLSRYLTWYLFVRRAFKTSFSIGIRLWCIHTCLFITPSYLILSVQRVCFSRRRLDFKSPFHITLEI